MKKYLTKKRQKYLITPLKTIITSTALLALAAMKNGIKVMMTGMGADEYFGGYARAKLL